jgi:transcriptional regulator with XRE-family HTH domain
VLSALRENTGFALAVIAHKSARNLRLFRTIARLNTATVEQSIGRTLYELGIPGEGGSRVVDKRITQQDIADALGLSREQVNKVLKMLEQKGLVTREPVGYVLGQEFSQSLAFPLSALEAEVRLEKGAEQWRASRKREEAEERARAPGTAPTSRASFPPGGR